jgi:hypothetical protein
MNGTDPITVGEVEDVRRELLSRVDNRDGLDEGYAAGYVEAVLQFDRRLTDRRLTERDG